MISRILISRYTSKFIFASRYFEPWISVAVGIGSQNPANADGGGEEGRPPGDPEPEVEVIRANWARDVSRGKNLRTGRYPNGDKMKRTDGGIGAKCGEIGMLSPNTEVEADRYFGEAVRKLRRLQKWTDHFGLKETLLPDIIHWAQDTEQRRHVLNFG